MAGSDSHSTITGAHGRIYRLKLIITGISLAFLGVLASLLADFLAANTSASHLLVSIVRGLSDLLLVTGAIGIALDFITGRDKEAADMERTRAVVKELAPEFTDAVVRGFAVEPEDLKRVATPEQLDNIASNALGLRLDDAEFAREVYAELVENVIRAPERWHDVDVRVRLSSIDESTTQGGAHTVIPAFAVTITWEYSVVPSNTVQRFACTSDRDEFHELVSDIPSTSTWFMTPRPGFDAADRGAFELLQYTLDGQELSIRRAARKTGQTYSVKLEDEVVREKRQVRVRHTYRTVVAKDIHRIFLAIAQPTHGLTLTMDYTDTDIAEMTVTDLVSSAQRPRISRMPEQAETREVTVDVPGWLLPQAEVMFVWTLASERARSDATAE